MNSKHRLVFNGPRMLVALFLAVSLTVFASAGQAQGLRRNPSTFGTMICSQFWYLENKILAEGRVCLKSERARRAFKRVKPCISDDERILAPRVRTYLEKLRVAAAAKNCPR